MLGLERTKVFKKDISKLKFSNQHYAKYILYLGVLLKEEALPTEAKDHELKGSWQGYREFHISGDLLLIYKIEDEVLYLVRIGSHTQLFE
jgi:mRNA interferase YafQ